MATSKATATANSTASTGSAHLEYDTEMMSNYIPVVSQNTTTSQEVQSYTLNVTSYDPEGFVMSRASVFIQASTGVLVNLNGKTIDLSLTPTRCVFDVTAEICIIAASTGLTTPTYTFSNLQDAKGLLDIKNGNDLKTKPGRTGQSLYTTNKPPVQSDLEVAAQTFKDLASHSAALPAHPPAVVTALEDANKKAAAAHPTTQQAQAEPQSQAKAAVPAVTKVNTNKSISVHKVEKFSLPSFRSIGNDISSAGHVIKMPALRRSTASRAVLIASLGMSRAGEALCRKPPTASATWSRSQATWQAGCSTSLVNSAFPTKLIVLSVWTKQRLSGSTWSYVAKLKDKVFTFVVEKAEDVGHAFDTVWNEIQLGWAELVMWAGFLFDWKAIISTQKSLQSAMEASLQYYADKLKDSTFNFDGALNTLTKAKALRPAQPDVQVIPGKANSSANTSSSGKALQSTPTKWLGHQMKHGGMSNMTSSDPAVKSSPSSSIMNEIKPILDSISPKVHQFINDIEKKFNLNSLLSAGDLLGPIADDVLNDMVDAVGDLIRAFLHVLGDILSLIERVGKAKINVPILSTVFKAITGGEDLTLISLVTLLAAIPTSVVTRLLTRKSYPTPNVDKSNITKLVPLNAASSTSSAAAAPKNGSTAQTPSHGTAAAAASSIKMTVEAKSAAVTTTTSPHKTTTTTAPPLTVEAESIKTEDDKPTDTDIWAAGELMGVAIMEMVMSIVDVMDQEESPELRPAISLRGALAQWLVAYLKYLGYLFTLPKDKTIPGWDLRTANGSIKAALAAFTFCLIPFDQRGLNDLPQALIKNGEILVGVTSFVLGSLIVDDELHDHSWRDYSEKRSGLQCGANVSNFLATCCDFTGYIAKQGGQPEAALIALQLRMFSLFGRVTLLAGRFASAYDDGKNAGIY